RRPRRSSPKSPGPRPGAPSAHFAPTSHRPPLSTLQGDRYHCPCATGNRRNVHWTRSHLWVISVERASTVERPPAALDPFERELDDVRVSTGVERRTQRPQAIQDRPRVP